MNHTNPTAPSPPSMLPALWWGWIFAPAWWLAQFEVRYAAVPWACHHGHRWLVLVIGLVALAVAVGLAGWSWRLQRRPSEEPPAGFLNRGAHWAATFFAFLVLTQLLPDFFLDPCQH